MHAVGSLVHITRDGKGIGPLVVAAHDGIYHNLNNLDGTPNTAGWLTESLTKYTPDLDFFRPGDVVKVEGRGEGIVANVYRLKYSGYVRVAVEGAGVLSPERPWTDGYPVYRVTFIERGRKATQTFKFGDTVRFTSGPNNGVVAKVDTIRENGNMLWVRMPNGELSGGWSPTRFELVTAKDNAEAVKQVSSNNAQTYEAAVSGVQKLLRAGYTAVAIRPRTWDTKGIYAAVEVTVDGVKVDLYTPEKVEAFIKRRTPKEVTGRADVFDGNRFEFKVGTGSFVRSIPSPKGNMFWSREELVAANSRVTFEGQAYILGILAFTPFTPQA